MAKIDLSKEAITLLQDVHDMDGVEIHASQMKSSNVVELKGHGLIEFSGGRGPGGKWHRMECTEKGTAFMLKDKYEF